jgi:hypothetical protein
VPVAFRVLGRRQVGRLTNFDLVVVVVADVQNVTIGNDSSLIGGVDRRHTVLLRNTGVALGPSSAEQSSTTCSRASGVHRGACAQIVGGP